MPADLEAWMAQAHDDLAEAMRNLRRAVHARDSAAADRFAALESNLSAHMAQEETSLFPLYASHGGPFPRNATPQIFAEDHARLRRLLQADPVQPDTRAHAVSRCDRLWQLQGALEHHDTRERRYLVPRLASLGGEPLHAIAVFEPPSSAGSAAPSAAQNAAPWADDATGDPIEDLRTALAGAATPDRLEVLAAAVASRAASPKEGALAQKVVAAAATGDRPTTWDWLHSLRSLAQARR